MALDLEEQEQIDEFRAWWKQNGTFVIGAVAAFVIGVSGWKGYQVWSARQAGESMALFERAMQAAMANDAKSVKDLTGQIMENYGRSGYALPAAWLAGKVNFAAGDLKSAQAQYQYALDHADDKGLEQLARLRLATVMLDQKDTAGALKLLEKEPDAAFAGLFADLKGDALALQGKPEEARAAYALAMEKLDAKSPMKAMVEAKLNGVGG
ncbi:MAG: tetratricopeptide repeat protein [Gallionellaceae bacterium]|nr:tetratricopeptide repeat protein [Gallionellaceae bacterium]MDD5363804.1 tetratricopeptide repeat protein [Gallionellaceae bacterium]